MLLVKDQKWNSEWEWSYNKSKFKQSITNKAMQLSLFGIAWRVRSRIEGEKTGDNDYLPWLEGNSELVWSCWNKK